MAHSEKIISKITLPDGNTYEVHDANAIHDVSELGLSSALAFKGTKSTKSDLPTTGNKVGDVWLVTDKSQEYVWVEDILRGGTTGGTLVNVTSWGYLASTKTYSASQFVGRTVKTYDDYSGEGSIVITNTMIAEQTASGITIDLDNYLYIWVADVAGYKGLPSVGTYLSYCDGYDCQRVVSVDIVETKWEPLGSIHDAASSTHTHNVTVTGTNSSSSVTGTAVVPTVSATHKYIYATPEGTQQIVSTDAVDVLTAESSFDVSGGTVTNKHISANVDTNVAVGANGTAKAITGFGTHSTASAITSLSTTSINNPTVEEVTIPTYSVSDKTASKVTVTAGTAPSWTASVTNGVLSFGFSAGTTPSVVSATDVATSKVSSGTAKTASKVTTSAVTVATGSKSTANAITALGTPTTANALTGVKVTTQPTVKLVESDAGGDVAVASGIEGMTITPTYKTASVATAGAKISSPTIKLNTSTTNQTNSVAVATNVSVGQGTGSVTGTAAAQTWTQKSGTTGQPK